MLPRTRGASVPLVLMLCSISLLFFFGCTKARTVKKTISMAGSTTMLPAISEAAEDFMRLYPDIQITVSPGGSGVGVKSIGNGLVDIGMVSRDISDEERKNFPAVDFKLFLIGRDAVACVVSSEIYEAGVHALSKKQIGDIYSGEIDNWKEVGGPDKEILCIDKESHRGARQVFMEYVFGDGEAKANGADLVVGSNNETQAKVALSDAAIAMVSYAWINAEVKGIAIKTGEREVEPTVLNLKNGTYPISRDLFLVTNGAAVGPIKDFLDFMLSPRGQTIVRENGFISCE